MIESFLHIDIFFAMNFNRRADFNHHRANTPGRTVSRVLCKGALSGEISNMSELGDHLIDSEKDDDCLSPNSKRLLEKNDAAFAKPADESYSSSSTLVIQRPTSLRHEATAFNFGKHMQSTLRFAHCANSPSPSLSKPTRQGAMQHPQRLYMPLTSIGSR
jgi:hypothetical protein